MLKKFVSGIIFGSGFAIAALCAFTGWVFFVLPFLVNQSFNFETITGEDTPYEQPASTPNFYELSVDEKIELATAIIIVKFEEGKDGNYKSIVEDIVKQEEGVAFYYNVGEVYEENSHYKISDTFAPTRAIVFMQGNPATMSFSTTFDGERIKTLGGISLALLREKCNNT